MIGARYGLEKMMDEGAGLDWCLGSMDHTRVIVGAIAIGMAVAANYEVAQILGPDGPEPILRLGWMRMKLIGYKDIQSFCLQNNLGGAGMCKNIGSCA